MRTYGCENSKHCRGTWGPRTCLDSWLRHFGYFSNEENAVYQQHLAEADETMSSAHDLLYDNKELKIWINLAQDQPNHSLIVKAIRFDNSFPHARKKISGIIFWRGWLHHPSYEVCAKVHQCVHLRRSCCYWTTRCGIASFKAQQLNARKPRMWWNAKNEKLVISYPSSSPF